MKLCTDKEIYRDEQDKTMRNCYKKLAKGRIDKFAVAQLIDAGKYANNHEENTLNCFRLYKKQLNLTKEELILTKHCFKLAQTDLNKLLHKILLSNPAAANSMRVLAQMKNLIDTDNNNNNNNNNVQPTLNISLTKKKSKYQKEENKKNKENNNNNNNKNINKKPIPLQLVQNE